MGDNVVPLPTRLPMYWQCSCGCRTFWVRDDGVLECGHCHGSVEDAGTWRLPSRDAARIEDDAAGDSAPRGFNVVSLGSPEVAIKRVLREADTDKMCALIVLQSDGIISTWGHEFETPKKKAWLGRKLKLARQMLSDIEVSGA